MTTTPPPPSTPRIPPTPRFGGAYDQYEPYSTRHSARIAGQRALRSSTPPRFPGFQAATGSKGAKKERVNQDEAEALSPPGSIHGSPRKKSSGRSRTLGPAHSLQDDGVFNLADPFTTGESSSHQQPRFEYPTTRTNGMLPTPAKTPKKKAVGDMDTTARALFPPASGRPKKNKKHTGFSLDSFNDDSTPGQTSIQIYTDCRDRIPEVDESEENLFYKPKAEAVQTPKNTTTRAPRKPKASESKQEKRLKRDREIDDAVKRDDGMVYVFRGKKMFRKFNDPIESDGEEEDDDDLGLLAARPDLLESSVSDVRPLTRSSIKPRVLFPSAAKSSTPQQDHPSDVDEEAATDIEDHAKDTDDAAEQTADPSESATTVVPTSPSTSRSLRPRAKREEVDQHETTPTTVQPARKRISPFDAWQRKKPAPVTSGSKTKKREAEAVGSPGGPSTKRARGGRATATST